MAQSHKPTHGRPLTAEELTVPRNTGGKGWQAGARFVWVSHFGSRVTNTGDRASKGKGRGPATGKPVQTARPVRVPSWARKYGGGL